VVVVRDAGPGECADLSALAFESKASWGYDEAFMVACRDELTVRERDLDAMRVRVACDDAGCILGFHGVILDPPELWWMFVASGAHRSGVGTLLLEDACAVARAAGARTLRIESDPYAEAFYLRAGAKRIGETPSLSIPGRVLPLLELVVSSTG
jgi:GNAT superfamily N-acetyltransferase